ncbi:MAG: dihydropteroate synthase [Gammaproteobacteria bacterium]|nr:dihydropteroate synthase [Gammaproteobacteria bacterium]
MGILNITPDSFSDGGQFLQPQQYLPKVESMVMEGSDIIDIGGESTRPGAKIISAQEEIDRVIPAIEAIKTQLDTPISIDTSKPEVMKLAIKAGAEMINDVCGLRVSQALETAIEFAVPVCLMHMQGNPRTMQKRPSYDNVTKEVIAFLQDRVASCLSQGMKAENIILDPGFGFGKSVQDNLTLLKNLHTLCALGYPVLVGLSRKSMLGDITGKMTENRLPASISAALLAVQQGARIIRVHDVDETSDALKLLNAIQNLEQSNKFPLKRE